MLKYFIALIIVFILGLGLYSVTAATSGNEQPSPGDWIEESQIHISGSDVLLNIPGAVLTVYENTNSMDPILDEFTHGIEIPPLKEKLNVGDIVSYRPYESEYIIVHRIISVEEDGSGRYYVLQGDNNTVSDPQKVRFEDIVGVVVALIY